MTLSERLEFYPYLYVVIFLVIGITTSIFSYESVDGVWWLAASCILSISAFITKRYHYLTQILLLLTITSIGGALTFRQLKETKIRLPQRACLYKAVVASQPQIKERVIACDLLLVNAQKAVKVKANIYKDSCAMTLQPGDGMYFYTKLKEPANFGNATFDYRRYLLFHGYKATAFLYTDYWGKGKVSLGSLSVIDRLRLKALKKRNRLLAQFDKWNWNRQEYAIIAAMTLGDKSNLDKNTANHYSIAGASHILALSGLHLGIIYAILMLIAGRWRNRAVELTFVIPAIWVYVFLTGMPLSVVRAAIMFSVYSLLSIFSREKMPLNALAFTACCMLVSNPLMLYDVGFQLSFMAVFFIGLLYRPLCELLPNRWRSVKPLYKFWQFSAVSIAAQIGVAPLIAFYFNRFSCYFLLTNLLVIPLSTAIVYATVVMLLSSIVPMVQTFAAHIVEYLVQLLNGSIEWIVQLPAASIDNIHINIKTVCAVYAVIGCFCILGHFLLKAIRLYRTIKIVE